VGENEGIIYASRQARKEKSALRGKSVRRLTLLLVLILSFLSGKKVSPGKGTNLIRP